MTSDSAAPIAAVVLDYGGVLTNPLADTLVAFCRRVGVTPEDLLTALAGVASQWGEDPMARLEVGGCSEAEMAHAVAALLPVRVAEKMGTSTFGELWFSGRHTEPAVLALVEDLRRVGLATALLTNNVREWRALWTAQVDVTAFDVVVDSSQEGCRKPDPTIYAILLERLGLPASQVLLIDDTAENCEAARRAGMRATQWRGVEDLEPLRKRLLTPAGAIR